MIDPVCVHNYRRQGYTVVQGLFSADEVQFYIDHYMRLRLSGSYAYDLSSQNDSPDDDPLKKYPRLTHPHLWDEISWNWMFDDRIWNALAALLGSEPYAAQTMVYFKPPGARGQALHQDQFYLRVEPGTCVGAWLALDRCDEENGCLQIVPGTHDLPILCSVEADSSQSFTGDTVVLPEGMKPEPVTLEPGDMLFFNGQIIHGSFPNTSTNRFRRSLIGHYVQGDARKIAAWYNPIWRRDRSTLHLGVNPWGGPCGVWVNRDGTPMPEMLGIETRQNYDVH